MRAALDRLLPDAKVIEDLRECLAESDDPIEIDDTELHVSSDVELDVLAKSYASYRCDMGIEGFRVLIAVGGLLGVECGVPEARLCFSMVYYDEEGNLVTRDFSSVFF